MYNNIVFSLPSLLVTIAAAAVAISWFLFYLRKNQIIKNATETSTSSAEKSEQTVYEVFLSFCGIDTRKGFTNFLYVDLIAASIITFMDDNELRVGEKINPALVKAIQESKISIPILSKNYASSKWCLIELAEMVKCHENGGQMIYPIFYDVDPTDVRNQTGSYKKAFRQHKKKFDEETVRSWREALRTVGELKGLELKKETDGRQGELVKIVVKEVWLKLKKNDIYGPKNLVAMDDHIEKLKGLLKVDSKGLRIVGIHGMGGLGKTTIAMAIYTQLCEHFNDCCFLEDVRENSKSKDGIVNLQKQLISKIQKRKAPEISNANQGSNIIKDTVRGRNVLIVLDDVDESSPIDMLMGNQSWYDAGSRIIITTRDTKVLDVIEITCEIKDLLRYEPDLMDDDHSLKLFSKYAFMRDSPMEGYNIHSKEVVSIAAGLPLVLVVLGSTFCGEKDINFWEAKLEKLRVIPHDKVLEKLRISFEVLDYGQKQMFLDIACFFTGSDRTRPCYMWEDSGFYPKEGIKVLVRRSLIRVGDDNILRMHDQLRDLGRQIVREEGLNELGNQSRFWAKKEVIQMLETRQGTSRVNALSFPNKESADEQYQHRIFEAQDFHNLPTLRYLNVEYQGIKGDFKHLLSNLRWLKWICTGKFEPTNLHLKHLVVLDLSSNHFVEDWECWNQFKMSENLKVLDLSRSFIERGIPHLPMFASLERLKIQDCWNLCGLDGLEQLKSLTHLDATCCRDLKSLPNISNLRKLVELRLWGCAKLKEIQGLDKLESLQVLEVSRCSSLERLATFSNLKKLKIIEANHCYNLTEIEGLYALNSLEKLDLSECRSLKGVLDVSSLNKLKLLNTSGLKITDIPGLGKLELLDELGVSYDDSVSKLPDLSCLTKLKKLKISSCEKVVDFQGVDGLESLEELDIDNCRSMKRLLDLSCFKRLKKLSISQCYELIDIQELGRLESLVELYISKCTSIERLPNLSNLRKLKELTCIGCKNLGSLEGVNRLESLIQFYISECTSIKKLCDLPRFGKLNSVRLELCDSLHDVEALGVVESLESLSISYCNELREIPDLKSLKSLKELSFSFLEELSLIPGLEELKSLEVLSIRGCKSLVALPDFSNHEKLTKLIASGSVKLTEICGLERLKSLKMLVIHGCQAIRNLPDLPNTKIERDPTYTQDNTEKSECFLKGSGPVRLM